MILVTGGTGTLGRVLVPRLLATGQPVAVLSRSGRGAVPGAQLVTGDLLDRRVGARLRPVLAGAPTTVVHLASGGGNSDVRAAVNLLGALESERIDRLIYLSIVGVDQVPLPYYRAKADVERLIAASTLATTTLRATQFHDLVAQLVTRQSRLPWTLIPDIPIQPIDTSVVAARLAELVGQPPGTPAADLGGPVVEHLPALAAAYLSASGRSPRVRPIRLPGKTFAAYRAGRHLCPAGLAAGTPSFADWLTERGADSRG